MSSDGRHDADIDQEDEIEKDIDIKDYRQTQSKMVDQVASDKHHDPPANRTAYPDLAIKLRFFKRSERGLIQVSDRSAHEGESMPERWGQMPRKYGRKGK